MVATLTPEHGSALELIKALRDLGAVHVRVDGTECRFDALTMLPAPLHDSAEVGELKGEIKRLRRLALGGAFDEDFT
jgi:hypothetical protein